MIEEISIGAISKQAKSQEFNLETHSVSELFLRLLGKFHCGKAKKISISLYNFEPRVHFIDDNLVVLINMNIDIKSYFELDTKARKVWILHKLYDAMKILANKKNVDLNSIDFAYGECIARNFDNSWVHGGLIDLDKFNMKGLVICNHLSDEFIIRLKLFSIDGVEISDKEIIRLRPYYLEYHKYLGKIVVNKNVISVKTIEGEIYFSHDINHL